MAYLSARQERPLANSLPMAIAGRFPGGRPLSRRGCEGPQPPSKLRSSLPAPHGHRPPISLRPSLAGPFNEIFVTRQFFEAHRASGVKPVGAYSNFGPKSE